MNCEFCELTDENRTHVRDYKYWRVLVSLQQHTLGSVIVTLKRHAEYLGQLEMNEIFELLRVFDQIEATLANIFECDHINYLFLNDRIPHLKCHVIPRYREPREFFHRIYRDDNFGHRPMMTMIEAPAQDLEKLRETLQARWSDTTPSGALAAMR